MFFVKIWIYGDSCKSMLVAVVVLHEENTKSWAYLNGHMGSFTELCSLHQLQKLVLSELKTTAERNKVVSAQPEFQTNATCHYLPFRLSAVCYICSTRASENRFTHSIVFKEDI